MTEKLQTTLKEKFFLELCPIRLTTHPAAKGLGKGWVVCYYVGAKTPKTWPLTNALPASQISLCSC